MKKGCRVKKKERKTERVVIRRHYVGKDDAALQDFIGKLPQLTPKKAGTEKIGTQKGGQT